MFEKISGILEKFISGEFLNNKKNIKSLFFTSLFMIVIFIIFYESLNKIENSIILGSFITFASLLSFSCFHIVLEKTDKIDDIINKRKRKNKEFKRKIEIVRYMTFEERQILKNMFSAVINNETFLYEEKFSWVAKGPENFFRIYTEQGQVWESIRIDFFNNILEKENFEDFPKYFFRDKKFNKYLQNRDIMKLRLEI